MAGPAQGRELFVPGKPVRVRRQGIGEQSRGRLMLPLRGQCRRPTGDGTQITGCQGARTREQGRRRIPCIQARLSMAEGAARLVGSERRGPGKGAHRLQDPLFLAVRESQELPRVVRVRNEPDQQLEQRYRDDAPSGLERVAGQRDDGGNQRRGGLAAGHHGAERVAQVRAARLESRRINVHASCARPARATTAGGAEVNVRCSTCPAWEWRSS